MQFKQMFVTAVCVLFLLNLKWPKLKNFYVLHSSTAVPHKRVCSQSRSQGFYSLSALSLRKGPGTGWSRVSQNLGGSPNVF